MTRLRALAALLVLAASVLRVGAQAPNDTCATAVPITIGVPVLGSNVGATTGPDPVSCASTLDVWYTITLPCNAQYVVSTCDAATNFDTVVAVWQAPAGCGALVPLACNDDNCGLPGFATRSRVTFTGSAGATCLISVGGRLGATGAFSLSMSLIAVMSLTFTDAGPGSLGYVVTGPAGGVYFVAVTLAAGAFPFGWFFGVDIALPEIVAQFQTGFPFTGLLSPCGDATVGPVGGVPSGLTLYAVVLGFAPGATWPTHISTPATGVAP